MLGAIRRLRRRLTCGRESRRGSVLMETALLFPLLIVLFAGTIEISMLFLARQTLSKLSSQTADMIAQSDLILRESDFNDVFSAIEFIASSHDLGNNGRIIVSGIMGTDQSATANEIVWQRCTGDLNASSSLGDEGAVNIELPGNVVLSTNEMAVLAEVSMQYQPLIFDMFFGEIQLNSDSMFRPRFGALDTIEADMAPAACI